MIRTLARSTTCLQFTLERECHRLSRNPSAAVLADEVESFSPSGWLCVQKIVDDDAVEDRDFLEPYFHRPRQCSVDHPTDALVGTIFGHLDPQVRPPRPPTISRCHRLGDARPRNSNECLIRYLDTAHRKSFTYIFRGAAPEAVELLQTARLQYKQSELLVSRANRSVVGGTPVREFTVPARFKVEDGESAVDSVFTRRATAPESVAFLRQENGSWIDVTADQFATKVVSVAKGLIASGVEQGDRVALMSSTRYEWSVLDYAIWAAGGVTVPIYETSSANQVEWILSDAEPVLLVLENKEHLDEAADVVAASKTVRRTFQVDGTTADTGAIHELVELGAPTADGVVEARVAALRSSDPATLIYTSGTTGRPKGVQLTHANLLAESKGIRETTLKTLMTGGTRTLMFLPLAHVLARAVTIAAFDAGTTVGHTNDIPNLVATFGSFQPDFILSVPRVFEKVFNTAKQKAHADGKGKIFDAAADTAVAWSQSKDDGSTGIVLRVKHAVFDKLVYSKLRAALGGNCKLAISGGAPLGARLGHFYRGIGVPIYEGYGLTETSAAFAVNTIGYQHVGSVGRPLPGNTVRIAPDGEIQLRGPVVFAGYWRNEEATAESLDDGWFCTGDLGSLDADGYITITGRKKELIVTAGGKNVSPAGLEDQLRAHALISQAIVVGDQKPFIGALVTLDADALTGWKARNSKPADSSAADLATDPDLIAEIDAAIAEANKSVSHAEGIKKYRILPNDFTEEAGEVTPTMKLKRNVITKTYADDVEAIYSR